MKISPFLAFKLTLHIVMGLMYVIVGSCIIYYQWFLTQLEVYVAWSLGILAILYGLFRCYRGYQLLNEE
jgi:hypothetical protein